MIPTRIARAEQTLLSLEIVQHEREHSVQLIEEPFSSLLVEVKKDFRIRVRRWVARPLSFMTYAVIRESCKISPLNTIQMVPSSVT